MVSAEERVLIMAPLGRDAVAMTALLAAQGIAAEVCVDPEECLDRLRTGAGALVLTEEALELPRAGELLDTFKFQPAWSELPLIVLTSGGETRLAGLLELAASAAGSVTFLERPMTPATLFGSVRVALRSRRRQYQVRDLMAEQERQQRQLRESEARYRALASHLPGGAAFIVDRDLRYVAAEGEALQSAGVSSATFVGKTVREMGDPQFATTFELLYRKALSGEAFSAEHEAHGRWYVTQGVPLRDEAGTVTSALAASYDITERKRAEMELQQAHKRVQDLISSITDGLLVLDSQWRYTYFSQRAAEILHVRPEEMLGKVIWDLFPEARGTKFDEFYHRAAETGQPQHFEECHPEPLNQWLECHCYPNQTGLTVYFHDVTERKRSQERAAELQRKLDSALLAGEVGTFEWLVTEDRLWGDRNFERIFGLSADASGTCSLESYMDRIHPDDRPRILEQVNRTVQTGCAYEAEYRINHGSNTRWVVARGTGDRDKHGRVVRFPGVVVDITARKLAEEELRKSEQHREFLLRLSDALRPLADPTEIQNTAVRALGEHLRVHRAFYTDVVVEGGVEYFVIEEDYHTPGTPTLVGRYPVNSFGPARIQEYRDGKPIAVADVGADDVLSDQERAAYRKLKIRSYVGVPLVKDGRFVAVLGLHHADPRQWTPEEVALVQDTAERTWAAVERARAEAALKASEERFRSVLEHMSEGLMLFDAQENLIYQNPASLRIHGFEAPDRGLIAHDNLPATWKAWDQTGRPLSFDEWPVSRVFRHEKFQDQVLRVVRVETGKEFFGSYNGSPILNEDGKLTLGFITIRDVTEQFRAHEALERSQRRVRTFFESEMMGALYWNMDGQITNANDKFLRMVGYTREDLVSGVISWRKMSPLEFQERDDHAIKELRANGVDTPYEKEFLRKDGTRIPILIGAAMLDADRHEGVAFVLDITERKRAEAALLQQQRQLALALDAGKLVPWEINLLTGEVKHSEQLFELFGIDPTEEMHSREQWRARVHQDDRLMISRAVEAARTGKEFHIEYRIHHPRGGVRWHESHAVAVADEHGGYVRLVGFARDITERKEFEAELERLVAERTAKLQELVGELEHFSYTITHDMRAPLRSMRGFAELVEDLCQNADQKALLRRVITSAERMDLLITDALSYSQAVRQHLPLGPVDVGALLRGMLDSYPEYQTTNARITIQGELPLVLANQAGLTQCFSNLLGNAIKFVKPDQRPEVNIWAELVGTREALHGAGNSQPWQWVRIWVEDHGIGIPDTMLPRIFNMFARGTSTYEGSGIGLALVRKVVDRMGGRVGVQSEEGKGSRFWIELLQGDPREPVPSLLPSSPARPGTIL